jgi:hypothetical protein
MPADLTAASRHQHLALYDPSAIPSDLPVDADLDTPDPTPLSDPVIRDLTARGGALILRIAEEDCEARMRVFVDEEPPQALLERGALIVGGGTLRVPTGTLRADGLEFIASAGQVRTHSRGETIAVPAGDYEVAVRELMSWKLRHRTRSTHAGTQPTDRIAHRLITAYTWVGIILIPANLLGAPILIGALWQARGWQTGVTAAAVVLVIDTIIIGGFWLLQAAQKRFPALTRIQAADAAFDDENPDLVIVLKRQTCTATGGVPTFGQIVLR